MASILDILPTVALADHLSGRRRPVDLCRVCALPDDGTRYEVIAGVLYMAPAPGTNHQATSARLVTYLVTHIEFAGLGRVFAAPIDVELAPDTVVQPDIIVILSTHQSIITPSRIVGAPDLVVEIASPSTAGYDRREKQDAYAAAGVSEYWIVDPHAQTVEVLHLDRNVYRSRGVFRGQAQLPSMVVPTLPVPVGQFF
ncbi:MAG: Uma2 family endonuclease [Blastochloris sp.]|nr:Uma2 family endonuclease [Blastochloris sp.]